MSMRMRMRMREDEDDDEGDDVLMMMTDDHWFTSYSLFDVLLTEPVCFEKPC